jgi:hypothetical protein
MAMLGPCWAISIVSWAYVGPFRVYIELFRSYVCGVINELFLEHCHRNIKESRQFGSCSSYVGPIWGLCVGPFESAFVGPFRGQFRPCWQAVA